MKTIRILSLMMAVAAIIFSCGRSNQSHAIMTQKDFPVPPVALVKPDTFREFGHLRIDNYFWMKACPSQHRSMNSGAIPMKKLLIIT